MGDAAGPRSQSVAAKQSWGRHVTRERRAFFDFEATPELVAFVAGQLPERCRVVLLGGGRGYLGRLLDNGARQFVNLDIAPSGRPFVPSSVADMEAPLPLTGRRVGELPWAAVAAFSVEYTDAARSLGRLAEVLRGGERLVWISHHGDSFILADLRTGRELCRLVGRAAEDAHRLPSASWPEVARRAAEDAAVLALPAEGERAAELRFLLDRLAEGGGGHPAEARALARMDALRARLEREVELSRILVDRPLRTPQELASLAGAAFRLVLGGPVAVDGRPLCLVAVFERN